MPKVSDAHLEGRKDQILDAAAERFANTGFHATSMADIIGASGLSAGSMYRYFKSKDELIGAIIDRLMETVMGELTRSTEAAPPGAETIALSVQTAQQILSSQPLIAKLLPQLWTQAVRDEAIRLRAQKFYRTLLAHFTGNVRRAQASGSLSAELDADGVAQVGLALVQGFMVQRLMLQGDVNPESYLQTVRQLIGAGLRSPS